MPHYKTMVISCTYILIYAPLQNMQWGKGVRITSALFGGRKTPNFRLSHFEINDAILPLT